MKNLRILAGIIVIPTFAGIGLIQVLHSQPTSAIDRAREAVAAAESNVEATDQVTSPDAVGESTPTGEPDVTLDMSQSELGGAVAGGGTYSVNYIEEPIRNIIRSIAEAEGLNVVIPEDLTGNATLKLQDVEWETIFDLVLRDTRFVWKDVDGIIEIARPGAEEAIQVDPSGLVTARFAGEPLRSAVQVLADKSGLSIVIPSEFPGTTSASFSGLSWRRALTLILEENSYQWFEDEGVIRIRRVDSRVTVDPVSGLLTIDADEVPFEELVALIGETQVPPVNVIAPPEIADVPISLSVRSVEFTQAIELAIVKLPKVQQVDAQGQPLPPTAYYLVQDSPTLYKVVDQAFIDALASQPDEVRIYPIRYAQASQVLDMLMPYNDPGARRGYFRTTEAGVTPVVTGVRSIAADTANNVLVVTAKPSAFQRLENLIESLDQPIQQVMIETRFVEVSNVDSKDIGVNWSSLRNFTVGTSEDGFTRVYNRFSGQNMASVSTDAAGISATGGSTSTRLRSSGLTGTDTRISSRLDSRDSSSNSGTSFATGEETRVFESDVLGIQTEQIPFNTSQENSATSSARSSSSTEGRTNELIDSFSDTLSLSEVVSNVTGTARADSVVFGTSAFQLVLSALKENTDARLMSNPTVITMNGRPARIFISEILYRQGEPVAGETGPAQPGGPVLLENQPQTLLEVTPTVVGGEMIALSVRPEINNQVGTQLIESVGTFAAIPTIRQRFTESTVLLRSGYTLAIGGLMDEDSLMVETKVPVLGDIPLVGRLFRHDSRNVQVRNQIIFITASLLNPQTATFRDVVGDERMNEMGLSDKDVMGVGASNRVTEEEAGLNEQIRQWRNEVKEQERIEVLQKELEALKKANELLLEKQAAEREEDPAETTSIEGEDPVESESVAESKPKPERRGLFYKVFGSDES